MALMTFSVDLKPLFLRTLAFNFNLKSNTTISRLLFAALNQSNLIKTPFLNNIARNNIIID